MNKKGFTLIEILAVIVLIGVIMTISIVSIQNAKNSVLNTIKKEEKRIIKEALLMAAIDLDDEQSDIYNCDNWPHNCDFDSDDYWSIAEIEIYELINKGYLEDKYGRCQGNSFVYRNNGNYSILFEDVACN